MLWAFLSKSLFVRALPHKSVLLFFEVFKQVFWGFRGTVLLRQIKEITYKFHPPITKCHHQIIFLKKILYIIIIKILWKTLVKNITKMREFFFILASMKFFFNIVKNERNIQEQNLLSNSSNLNRLEDEVITQWPREWRHHRHGLEDDVITPHGLENDVIPPPWPRGFRHHPHGLENDVISSIASGMTSLPHGLEDDIITPWSRGWRHQLNGLEDDVFTQCPRKWRHYPHGLEDIVITHMASRLTSSAQ